MVLCHRKDVFQRRFSYNCPRSDEPLLKYCCAPDDRSATCCQYPSSTAGVNNIYGLDADDHVDGVGEFVTSVVGGVIVLVVLVCCVSCFCCPFCALHKWRKNRGRTRNPNPSATGVNAVPLSSFAQQPASGYPSGPAAAYPSQQGYPPQQGYPMPQPQGYPMQQPQGYPMPQPQGYPMSQPQGYPMSQPQGYPMSQPQGYPMPQPQGYAAQQPQGYPMPVAQGADSGGAAVSSWRADADKLMQMDNAANSSADNPPPYASIQKQPPYNPNF